MNFANRQTPVILTRLTDDNIFTVSYGPPDRPDQAVVYPPITEHLVFLASRMSYAFI